MYPTLRISGTTTLMYVKLITMETPCHSCGNLGLTLWPCKWVQTLVVFQHVAPGGWKNTSAGRVGRVNYHSWWGFNLVKTLLSGCLSPTRTDISARASAGSRIQGFRAKAASRCKQESAVLNFKFHAQTFPDQATEQGLTQSWRTCEHQAGPSKRIFWGPFKTGDFSWHALHATHQQLAIQINSCPHTARFKFWNFCDLLFTSQSLSWRKVMEL
jgi:hypothetical protein